MTKVVGRHGEPPVAANGRSSPRVTRRRALNHPQHPTPCHECTTVYRVPLKLNHPQHPTPSAIMSWVQWSSFPTMSWVHYSVLSTPEADDEEENDEKEIHQEASSCQVWGALDRSLFLAPHSSHHHLVYTYSVGAPHIRIRILILWDHFIYVYIPCRSPSYTYTYPVGAPRIHIRTL